MKTFSPGVMAAGQARPGVQVPSSAQIIKLLLSSDLKFVTKPSLLEL